MFPESGQRRGGNIPVTNQWHAFPERVNHPRSKLLGIAVCPGTEAIPEASFAVSNRKKELMKESGFAVCTGCGIEKDWFRQNGGLCGINAGRKIFRLAAIRAGWNNHLEGLTGNCQW